MHLSHQFAMWVIHMNLAVFYISNMNIADRDLLLKVIIMVPEENLALVLILNTKPQIAEVSVGFQPNVVVMAKFI